MLTIREARQLYDHLAQDKTRREAMWRQLSKWICPWRGRFDITQNDISERPDYDIHNHIAGQAVLRGASGMTSGMTPRNISWFKPGFSDPNLMEASGARLWLDELDRIMKDALAEGGFYQAIQNFNLDLLWAGCALLYVETGSETILNVTCCQPGSFMVQTDSLGRLEAVARRLQFSLKEAAELFGKEKLSPKSQALLQKTPLAKITVHHLVSPIPKNEIREEGFTCQSLYWEDGARDDFLRKSGFHEMPFFFTRWNDGATSYGTGPGDMCLTDARQIDTLERIKLSGLGKLVDPPVSAPMALKDSLDLTTGAVNFTHERELVTPILDLSPYASSMRNLMDEINIVAQRLEHGLMAAIFSSMPLDQRPSGMSATEFLERKRETLQQLGPVISAYEPNVLTPLLFRVANCLDRAGLCPPLPRQLQAQNVFMKMDFISPMSNALRQTGAETTRAIFQDIALMFQATRREEILDKIDLDQVIDELATGIGAPGSIIRSDEDVNNIRLQRQQAMQQQQQLQAGLQAGQALAGMES